jgi:hypothetical protein
LVDCPCLLFGNEVRKRHVSLVVNSLAKAVAEFWKYRSKSLFLCIPEVCVWWVSCLLMSICCPCMQTTKEHVCGIC